MAVTWWERTAPSGTNLLFTSCHRGICSTDTFVRRVTSTVPVPSKPTSQSTLTVGGPHRLPIPVYFKLCFCGSILFVFSFAIGCSHCVQQNPANRRPQSWCPVRVSWFKAGRSYSVVQRQCVIVACEVSWLQTICLNRHLSKHAYLLVSQNLHETNNVCLNINILGAMITCMMQVDLSTRVIT